MTDFDATQDTELAPDTGEVEAPPPPDLSESIQQMQQTQQEMLNRLPAEEEEPEGGLDYGIPEYDSDELEAYAERSGLLAEDDDGAFDLDEVENLISERVDAQVRPIAAQIEYGRRVDALHGLAARYEALRDPEQIEAIAAEVEQLGEAYGIAGADTDPALVELVLQARAARAGAAAETPAEAGSDGATLETGAGPSAPQQEGDPETKALEARIDKIIARQNRASAF